MLSAFLKRGGRLIAAGLILGCFSLTGCHLLPGYSEEEDAANAAEDPFSSGREGGEKGQKVGMDSCARAIEHRLGVR